MEASILWVRPYAQVSMDAYYHCLEKVMFVMPVSRRRVTSRQGRPRARYFPLGKFLEILAYFLLPGICFERGDLRVCAN
jgi:hypothetical protein